MNFPMWTLYLRLRQEHGDKEILDKEEHDNPNPVK
jgi:hypothetical protein